VHNNTIPKQNQNERKDRFDQSEGESNPLYGVKGWLKFFVVVNLYVAPVVFVLRYILAWVGFSILAEDYPLIIVVGFIETVIGAFIVYRAIQIARGLRDIIPGAVQKTKNFLKLVLAWTILSIFLSYLSGLDADDLMPGNIRGLLSGIIGFAIWYSYFNVSKRVRATYPDAISATIENTASVGNNVLPIEIKCPACSADLELEESERKTKQFTCPICNKFIDLH